MLATLRVAEERHDADGGDVSCAVRVTCARWSTPRKRVTARTPPPLLSQVAPAHIVLFHSPADQNLCLPLSPPGLQWHNRLYKEDDQEVAASFPRIHEEDGAPCPSLLQTWVCALCGCNCFFFCLYRRFVVYWIEKYWLQNNVHLIVSPMSLFLNCFNSWTDTLCNFLGPHLTEI